MTPPEPTQSPLLCRRNAQGRIEALTRQTLSAQELATGEWQPVSPNHADVAVFMRDVASQANALSQTDTSIARVLEDLIDLLITRGLIHFTELPEAAQVKLLTRRKTRANLSDRLQLLPRDGDGEHL